MSHPPIDVAPLISITSETWDIPLTAEPPSELRNQRDEIGKNVVKALQTSGFLLVQSDIIPEDLQTKALKDAEHWLTSDSAGDETKNSMVAMHPSDPKCYVMLDSSHYEQAQSDKRIPGFSVDLQKYWEACQTLKACILRAIGIGLNLECPEDPVQWHSQRQNSAMRLLHYPPAPAETGNRCKEHSDYGCLTLLSTDGVSGLEILVDGHWWPVPHIPGTIVVNIGSLLSDWTDQRLLATLHRVAGPASANSASDSKVLRQAIARGRTSIAFFVDPDDGSPLLRGGNIRDYIRWRSGGSAPDRSGIAFTSSEQQRLK